MRPYNLLNTVLALSNESFLLTVASPIIFWLILCLACCWWPLILETVSFSLFWIKFIFVIAKIHLPMCGRFHIYVLFTDVTSTFEYHVNMFKILHVLKLVCSFFDRKSLFVLVQAFLVLNAYLIACSVHWFFVYTSWLDVHLHWFYLELDSFGKWYPCQ